MLCQKWRNKTVKSNQIMYSAIGCRLIQTICICNMCYWGEYKVTSLRILSHFTPHVFQEYVLMANVYLSTSPTYHKTPPGQLLSLADNFVNDGGDALNRGNVSLRYQGKWGSGSTGVGWVAWGLVWGLMEARELSIHVKLEQLERVRSEDTPRRLNDYPHCWVMLDPPSQNKVEWPWRYRSRSKVMTCNKPPQASDHLYQIWKESMQNCRYYRADTIFKAKAKWPWR